MSSKKNKCLVSIAFFVLMPDLVWAAPLVSSVNGNLQNGQIVTMTGSGFGIKSIATPKYFNNLESETIGQIPHDQMTNISKWGTTQANVAHTGNNSLEWNYCADLNPNQWVSGGHYYPDYIVYYQGVYYRVKNNIIASTTPDLDQLNYEITAPRAITFLAGKHYYPGYIVLDTNGQYYQVRNEVNPSGTHPYSDPINYESISYDLSHCANQRRQEDWIRNGIDLGEGADRIYMSVWVYLDRGNSTARNWQWKAFNITSSKQLYYDLQPQYQVETTSQQTNYWWNEDSDVWNNTHAYGYYWNGNAPTHIDGTPGAPSDALLWNQWQRLEFYAQRSSASGVPDGIWREQRIGRSGYTFNITNAKNWVTGNSPWRYVALSHAIASVYTGYLDLKIYMDDIYVDTTQSRIEICDNATWQSRTHCEVQRPSAWSDAQVQFTINKGSFSDGQAYLFVIDENGNPSEGYPIVFGVGGDVTSPATPTGLSVQ